MHERPNFDVSPPTKRLRTTTTAIGPPDGFALPSPQQPSHSKGVYKPPANLNFKSVFDTATTVQDATSLSLKKPRSNGSNRLTASNFISRDLKRKGSPELYASSTSTTRKVPIARPLKPPVFATPPRPKPKNNPDQKAPTESTASVLKRIHPVSLPKSVAEPSKPKSLRAPPPPPPILPPSKPQPVLKVLPPPPISSLPKKGKEKETAQSRLRTISTTDIALATDLTSETGSASLLSIFLQGNKPDVSVIEEGDEDREARRGVGVSPVKRSAKGKGFIRNGLAERASNLLSRSQTAFTLWHNETQPSLISSTSRRPTPDLHLRILKTLHHQPPTLRSTPAPSRSIIALCHILKKPRDEQLMDSIYPILFSSPTSSSIHAPAGGFQEGTEMYVWRPWFVVELAEPGISLDGGVGDEDSEMRFGLGSGPTVGQSARSALLCSRFFVVNS